MPSPSATTEEIVRFATTSYFGYDRHGGVHGLGEVANRTLERWRRESKLPESEDQVRAALFFEARRWHHDGRSPDEHSEECLRALVGQLRVVSGGTVVPDRDGIV